VIRIDAHHHVWELGRRPQAWLDGAGMAAIRRDFTMADLAPLTAAAGIDRTILVQVLPSRAETAEFLALAGEPGPVAGVVGWTDLTSDRVRESLDALRSGRGGAHLVGIRHLVQGEPDPRWLAWTDVRRGLRAVAGAGLVYDLLTLPHQLPAAIDTARALPGLTFVVDHLSKPPIAAGGLDPWAALVRELAALPNVSCKLSGMITEAGPHWTVAGLRPYAEAVLDAFGPARVMFGSDWPVCLLAASYADVTSAARELTAALTREERALVFGGTAARVYGLPDAGTHEFA
jgi:L-fuconolactonase